MYFYYKLKNIINFIKEIKKSSIGESIWEKVNYEIENLTSIEQGALAHICFLLCILFCLISIFISSYGEFVIEKFNLSKKFPALVGIFRIKNEFKNVIIIFNFVLILFIVLFLIFVNIYVFLL